MNAHLTEERLADLLDDTAAAQADEHLRGCVPCRERLEEARAGMALALEAEVPEPSPLYWEGFQRGVGRRLAQERRSWGRAVWPAVATLAAGLVYVSLPLRPTPPPSPEAMLPAWSALPAAENDADLEILQAVVAQLPPEAECRELAECVTDLTDEEGGALAEMLKQETPGRSS